MADIPGPNPYPTPTPTPRPATPGYVSPADYVACCVNDLRDSAKESNSTFTYAEVISYIDAVKDVLYTAET